MDDDGRNKAIDLAAVETDLTVSIHLDHDELGAVLEAGAALPRPHSRRLRRSGASVAGDAVTGDGVAPASRLEMPPVGSRLAGRFELCERIGAGGMGVVFRAVDLELEETIAIKVLHPEVQGSSAALLGLRREIRAARAVNSPFVARMFELHHHDDLAFLCMEFIDGRSLADELAGGRRVELKRALEIVRDVCTGLAAAHARGVVHRDIKPGNILLRSNGAAVIGDFGLAHFTAHALTVSMGAVGTPAYMAPEQANGGAISPATDIFALGIVLYELLSGTLPWTGRNAIELAVARLSQAAIPLAPTDPKLPAALRDWTMRAISRDPGQRWPTGTEALAALNHAIATASGSILLPAQSDRGVEARLTPVSSLALPLLWLQPFESSHQDDRRLAELLESAHDDAFTLLGEHRSLRLLAGEPLRRRLAEGAGPDEIARSSAATHRVVTRVKVRGAGLRVTVRLIRVDVSEVQWTASFDVQREAVELIGETIGRRVAMALGARSPGALRSHDRASIDSELVQVARRNLYSSDPCRVDIAAALLSHALEQSGGDPVLRILRAWALLRHWHLSGRSRPERVEEILAASHAAGDGAALGGEPQLALAQLRYGLGDAAAAARFARRAIASSPSLAQAHELLGRILLQCDQGDDGLQRLAAARRMAPELLPGRLARCRWSALSGDWISHDAELARIRVDAGEQRLGWTWRLRAALWRRDRPALEALATHWRSMPAVNADEHNFAALRAACDVALDRAGDGVLFDGIALRCASDAIDWLQLHAEIRAFRGETDGCLRAAAAALGYGAVSLAWWRRCPLLVDVRDNVGARPLQELLETRAFAVAAALREAEDIG